MVSARLANSAAVLTPFLPSPPVWCVAQSPVRLFDGAAAGGGRKLNENKALSSKKNRFTPLGKKETFRKCRVCKSYVHQKHAHYCNQCAYKAGVCCMCGKQVINEYTKKFSKMSS